MSIKPFKQFLVEISRTRKYYQDNPSKMSQDIAPGLPKNIESSLIQGRMYQIPGMEPDKIYAIEKDIRDNWPKVWDEYYSLVSILNGIAENRVTGPSAIPRDLIKKYKSLADRTVALLSIGYNKIKKLGLNKGLSPEQTDSAIGWINHYTGMSKRKLDDDVIPLIKRLTVEKNRLPKTIYRGIFFDGADIKDREKFMTEYQPGNTIKLSKVKTASWSSSKAVAVAFMEPQNTVKDIKNGFYVLYKLNLDSDKNVIADLRNLPEQSFWNQQEIIISKDQKTATVEAVFSPNKLELFDEFKKKNIKYGHGGYGMNKRNLIINKLYDIKKLDIGQDIKDEVIMSLNKLTTALPYIELDIKERFNVDYQKFLLNINIALYGIIRHLPGEIVKVYNPGKVMIEYSFKKYNMPFSYSSDEYKYLVNKIDELGLDGINGTYDAEAIIMNGKVSVKLSNFVHDSLHDNEHMQRLIRNAIFVRVSDNGSINVLGRP